MNDCPRFGEELSDVALGRAPSDALCEHLAQCSACTAQLERRCALAARMDAAVQALVRAQPSGRSEDIAARARVAQPQAQNRQWPVLVAGAAIAASLALIFGLRMLPPHSPSTANIVGLMQWHSPTASLLEPQGSILHAPLRDRWFAPATTPSHFEPSPGDRDGT